MKVDLSNNEMAAISIALDELSNSGDWGEHYTEKRVDVILDAMDHIKSKFPEGYYEQFENDHPNEDDINKEEFDKNGNNLDSNSPKQFSTKKLSGILDNMLNKLDVC